MAQLLSDTRKPYCDDSDLESSHAKLIRTVWFYCILFAFAESDSWRTDWYLSPPKDIRPYTIFRFEATRILSQHVPILISRTLIITQISYELNALINNGLFMKVKLILKIFLLFEISMKFLNFLRIFRYIKNY